MDALVTILLVVLVCAATLPLLALAVYALASAFGLGIADRILDTTMVLLKAQWTLGGVVNMLGNSPSPYTEPIKRLNTNTISVYWIFQ